MYTLCVCCCSCLNSKYTERTIVFRAVGIHCNFNRYVPLISICSEGGKRVLHAISMIDFMVPIYPKVIEHRMSCCVWRAKNVPLFRGAKKRRTCLLGNNVFLSPSYCHGYVFGLFMASYTSHSVWLCAQLCQEIAKLPSFGISSHLWREIIGLRATRQYVLWFGGLFSSILVCAE